MRNNIVDGGPFDNLLNTSVVVTGALVASTGNCSIVNASLTLTVSVVDPSISK